jgi:hypothetical protein
MQAEYFVIYSDELDKNDGGLNKWETHTMH